MVYLEVIDNIQLYICLRRTQLSPAIKYKRLFPPTLLEVLITPIVSDTAVHNYVLGNIQRQFISAY